MILPPHTIYVSKDQVNAVDLSHLLKPKAEGIPAIIDLVSLANLLGIKYRTLFWLRSSSNGMYKEFKIPKRRNKDGTIKFRKLHDPEPQLKYVQSQICLKILNHYPLPDYITGFRKGMSIRNTSVQHSSKNIVVSLDVKDYFGSIREIHVRKMFQTLFGYPEDVSRMLSEICCLKNFVPQGAPTSPMISNLVGLNTFDPLVAEMLQSESFIYTRYADDLTFSTDRDFPKISEPNETNPKIPIKSDLDPIIDKVKRICSDSGFQINGKKTKIMRKGGRQWVLGQVVNVEPNILRRDYHNLRAIVYNIGQNGVDHEAEKSNLPPHTFLQYVKGKISFLKQVHPVKGEKLYTQLKEVLVKKNENLDDIVEISIVD